MLLAALPEPKRARKEAFSLQAVSEREDVSLRSISINPTLSAAIAEADEAIPLE